MSGFFEGLTDEQKKAALEYRGDENHGELEIPDLVDGNDPILRINQPLYQFDDHDEEYHARLAHVMARSLIHYGGLGLAAPQLGLPHRMFVMATNPVRVCINPRIVDQSEEMVELDEGCLSFPKVLLNIIRPRRIRVRFWLPNKEVVTEVLHDLSARVYAHELDHCNGILFMDHVSKLKLGIAQRKARKKD